MKLKVFSAHAGNMCLINMGLMLSTSSKAVRGGRPVPTFVENPLARYQVSSQTRRFRHSEETLAAHQNAINRALGLSPEPGSPPDTEDDLIEIEESTEEDILLSEEQQGSQEPVARSPRSPLELIDLTNSPTTSCPVSPSALQSRSLSQPGNPPSPALQCPICLDTFSAIRSRGEPCLYFILHFSHRSFYQGSNWSAQSVATSSVGDVSSNVSSLLTQQQCPTCRRRIAHQDFHPLLL